MPHTTVEILYMRDAIIAFYGSVDHINSAFIIYMDIKSSCVF